MGHNESEKRWYCIQACRSKSVGSLETEWSQQIVDAHGVAEAFDKVRSLGWWPTTMLESGWTKDGMHPW